MLQALRGPLTVLGRLLLATIFLSAVDNKIPHFHDVAKVMESAGLEKPVADGGHAVPHCQIRLDL